MSRAARDGRQGRPPIAELIGPGLIAGAADDDPSGIATYLEVITAQNVYLGAQSTAIDIRTRRMTASVRLIQALGGGWDGLPQTASR